MLGAWLQKDGFAPRIIDQTAERNTPEEVAARILEQDPLLVGFSCLTPAMPAVEKVAGLLRCAGVTAPVVLGNTHAVVFAADLLARGVADYVVFGEGEATLADLARTLYEGKRPVGMPGVICLDESGNVVRGPERELIAPDDLPFPAWDLIDIRLYPESPMISLKDYAVPLQMSRGCDHRCVFCAQDRIHRRFRHRSVETVVDEIEHNVSRYGLHHFGFVDSYFPYTVEKGHEFCDELERRGLAGKIVWITETRVDKVNEKLLRRMKRCGCRLVMYGFESGSRDVLARLGKGQALEQARQAASATKAAGVYMVGLFMIGNPGETKEQCLETFRFARELDCEFVKFNVVVPLPGSRLYEKFVEDHGRVEDPHQFTSWYDWSDPAAGGMPDFAISEMSNRELSRLQKRGMIGYYLRPCMIWKHLRGDVVSLPNLVLGGEVLLSLAAGMALAGASGMLSRAAALGRGMKGFARRRNGSAA